MVKFNKPNIVIWNVTEQTAQLIDVKVPQDYNMASATFNNITKYKELQIEIQKLYNLKKVTIVPVVIGTIRSTYDSLKMHLGTISNDAPARIIQKTALLGTSHIIWKFLS